VAALSPIAAILAPKLAMETRIALLVRANVRTHVRTLDVENCVQNLAGRVQRSIVPLVVNTPNAACHAQPRATTYLVRSVAVNCFLAVTNVSSPENVIHLSRQSKRDLSITRIMDRIL
jgi:hypothetical protein